MPDPGEELVMVVGRSENETGIPCRNHCGYDIEMDGDAIKCLQMGGSLVCLVCATKLFRDHPDAVRRATDVEKLLGRDPK